MSTLAEMKVAGGSETVATFFLAGAALFFAGGLAFTGAGGALAGALAGALVLVVGEEILFTVFFMVDVCFMLKGQGVCLWPCNECLQHHFQRQNCPYVNSVCPSR